MLVCSGVDKGEVTLKAGSRRKTIAVLSDYISLVTESYEGRLRQLLHARGRERDVNLILVYGRALNEANTWSTAHNSIYALIDPARVDGVIVLSSLLSASCGSERMIEFAKRYASFAVCSVGLSVPGIPSIEVDNVPGMRALLEHLIVHHGYRRLAFIHGRASHPDSQKRHAVYQEALTRHGIAYDPRLVAEGDFVKQRGFGAMEQILSRDVSMDAVVCANDAMGLGAMEALRKRGHSVPGDLAVTGFDDLVYARLAHSPLTTVAQPLDAMAELSLHLVLEQLAGRGVPLHSVLETQLILRTSCGCSVERRPRRVRSASESGDDATEHVRAHHAELCAELAPRLAAADHPSAARHAEALVDALVIGLGGNSLPLLHAVEDALEAFGGNGERFRSFHAAMSWLRREVERFAAPALGALFHEVDERIVTATASALFRQRLELDYNYMQIVGSSERASVSFELDSLAEGLKQYLPGIGVTSAFLSRYVDETAEELEPFVRLVDGRLLDTPVAAFPARQLVPDGAFPQEKARTSVVFPLVFQTQCLGVAVFEYVEGIIGYQLLCDQASASLRSALLHREIVLRTTLHERSVQERIAATQRMQALRVLAGGVAHDLNNALGPLVALPDIMLQQVRELVGESNALRDLQADVESIKSATVRATQTIKDLLTLSRQGRTPKAPLDVNCALQRCLSPDALRLITTEHGQVRVVLELSTGELRVVASESHIVRAIMNLVHNAVQAIPGTGRVAVKTFATPLHEPHSGYETVPPGDYAVVTVSDDGVGLPPEALRRLFEPFFSTKAVQEHSGTGLGLAIVHGVVKEHEGFIDVHSSPDTGTTFSLYFPRSSEPLPIEPLSLPRRHERARILMVDDDPAQLRTARRVLTHYGYEVTTLDSAQQVLRVFDQVALEHHAPYELVILDMQLGADQDGLVILERIRRLFPGQKAIIVSGHAPSDRIESAVEGGIPWLVKPYTADAFAEAVREALAGRLSAPVLTVSSRPP